MIALSTAQLHARRLAFIHLYPYLIRVHCTLLVAVLVLRLLRSCVLVLRHKRSIKCVYCELRLINYFLSFHFYCFVSFRYVSSASRFCSALSCTLYPFICTCCLVLLLVVDHTRVVLRDGDPRIPGSDYINANYIRVPNSAFTF